MLSPAGLPNCYILLDIIVKTAKFLPVARWSPTHQLLNSVGGGGGSVEELRREDLSRRPPGCPSCRQAGQSSGLQRSCPPGSLCRRATLSQRVTVYGEEVLALQGQGALLWVILSSSEDFSIARYLSYIFWAVLCHGLANLTNLRFSRDAIPADIFHDPVMTFTSVFSSPAHSSRVMLSPAWTTLPSTIFQRQVIPILWCISFPCALWSCYAHPGVCFHPLHSSRAMPCPSWEVLPSSTFPKP